MTPLEIVFAAASLALQTVAVGAIFYGIGQMRRAGDQREKREDARHSETMEALRQQGEVLQALVRGIEQQGEALRQQAEALKQQGEALRQQGEALKIVIERTAAPA